MEVQTDTIMVQLTDEEFRLLGKLTEGRNLTEEQRMRLYEALGGDPARLEQRRI